MSKETNPLADPDVVAGQTTIWAESGRVFIRHEDVEGLEGEKVSVKLSFTLGEGERMVKLIRQAITKARKQAKDA